MAYQYLTNYNFDGIHEAFFKLKEHLKSLASPWVVEASSDGTTYNASGDQITHYSTGAGGLSNSWAWYVMRSPDSKYYFSYQRVGAQGFRIKVAAQPFNAGSPSATQVPATTNAADEHVALGGGTDASPSDTVYSATTGDAYMHICADDASPHGWYMIIPYYYTGGGFGDNGVRVFCFYDPLTDAPVSDTRAFITHFGYDGTNFAECSYSNLAVESALAINTPVAYFGSAWNAVSYMLPSVASGTPINSPFGGKTPWGEWPAIPVGVGRRSTASSPNGDKGTSTLIKWGGLARSHITLNPDSVAFGDIVLPWNGDEVKI